MLLYLFCNKSHYENVPFEIPESWAWVTLSEVCEVARGGSPRPIKDYLTTNEDGVNWIKIGDTDKDGKYINSTKEKIIPEGVHRSRFVHKGDFLLTNSMSFGRPYILNIDGCIHDGWLVISPFANTYVTEFLYFLLSSSFAYDQFADAASGGVVSNLNSDKVANSYFPLPPEREQRRIINELNNWFKVVGELDKNIQGVKSFVSRIKSKILDLAISGKLVPQDPNDEPAIELLKRINPDFKPCDNSHYENMAIPQSWELVSLNSVVDIISGVSYAKSDIKESGVRILRGGNIQDGEIICLEDDVFIDQSYSNMVNSVVKGDIVLVASTGSPTLIGKTGYARITYPDTQIGAFLRIIRPKSSEISAYLNLIFNSDFYKNYIRSLAKGTNINNVKNGYIEQFEIALPPIQEQERIVMMVENIFISLDNITAGLL